MLSVSLVMTNGNNYIDYQIYKLRVNKEASFQNQID